MSEFLDHLKETLNNVVMHGAEPYFMSNYTLAIKANTDDGYSIRSITMPDKTDSLENIKANLIQAIKTIEAYTPKLADILLFQQHQQSSASTLNI
jgi:hypothetical protein